MAEVKKQASNENQDSKADDGLLNFYYPDARDGQGGTVRAANQKDADKKAEAGEFINHSEAPATAAGEDKAE